MELGIICVALPFIPDEAGHCINILLFIIILFGFLGIVLRSKKYKYMADWFMYKFGDLF